MFQTKEAREITQRISQEKRDKEDLADRLTLKPDLWLEQKQKYYPDTILTEIILDGVSHIIPKHIITKAPSYYDNQRNRR